MSKRKANPAAVPMRDLVERIKAWHAESPMDPPGDMTLTAALTVLDEPISARLQNGWTIAELHVEFARLGLLTSLTTFRVTLGQVRKAKANPSAPERRPKQSKPSRGANEKGGVQEHADDEATDGQPPSAGVDAPPTASNDRIDSLRVDPPYPTSTDAIATAYAGKSEDTATSTEAPQQGTSSTSDEVGIGAGQTRNENGVVTGFVAGREQASEIARPAATKPDARRQADIATSADIAEARREARQTNRPALLDNSDGDFPTPMPNRRKPTE